MIRFIFTILVFMLCFSCGTKKNVAENSELTTKDVTQQVEIPRILKTDDSLTIVQKGEFLFVKKTNDSTILIGELTVKNDSVTFTKKTKLTTSKDSIVFHNDKTPKNENVKFVKSKKLPVFNHESWNTLLQKHVTKDGIVNYKSFKKDRERLQEYIFKLGKNMPLETWSKEAKLAYWINAYNAMTVDLILQNYPLKSIKDIRNPWNQRLWELSEKWYNLDEIEHKILRKMNEPRIHFAINCASFSCPPLLNEAFEADKLDTQLTQVTKIFLADSRRNTITKDQLEISKIFKWFSKDFKQNGSLIDFLNQYNTIKINEKAAIDYKDYDWSLNE